MPATDSQIAAYRAARYIVFVGGDGPVIVLRIGEPCPALDVLMEAEAVDCAAFVTAHNPRGQPADEAADRAAHGELLAATKQAGLWCYAGEGTDPASEWKPEQSLLIVGIPRAEAEALGRRFRQNAIVFVERGKAPELVLLAC